MGDAMSPDSYLLILRVNTPRSSLGGRPSYLEIKKTVILALKELYDSYRDRAVVEIIAFNEVSELDRSLS